MLNKCNAAIGFCEIAEFKALNGAGIYVDSSNLTLVATVLRDNKATNNGGGIYLQGASNAEISNCTLLNNDASVNGR